MYIGNFEIRKQEVSVALMILFALAAMFFLGYKYSYDRAMSYANEQIEERVDEFKVNYGIQEGDTGFILGNIELPDVEGKEDGK